MPVLLGGLSDFDNIRLMQFNDGSAGGYGGAGGAAGAVDEDDDGEQLPVDCLHTASPIFCCTLKFPGQYRLLEATMYAAFRFCYPLSVSGGLCHADG